jgi:hypothetical protein
MTLLSSFSELECLMAKPLFRDPSRCFPVGRRIVRAFVVFRFRGERLSLNRPEKGIPAGRRIIKKMRFPAFPGVPSAWMFGLLSVAQQRHIPVSFKPPPLPHF